MAIFSKKDSSSSGKEFGDFLGAGTRSEGNLNFNGVLRIEGEFVGEVRSQGTLVIGPKAKVEGLLNVGQLILAGNFTGDVNASEKIILQGTANMDGNLSTPKIQIDEGAILQGAVNTVNPANPVKQLKE